MAVAAKVIRRAVSFIMLLLCDLVCGTVVWYGLLFRLSRSVGAASTWPQKTYLVSLVSSMRLRPSQCIRFEGFKDLKVRRR
jgi:hypothetical protein